MTARPREPSLVITVNYDSVYIYRQQLVPLIFTLTIAHESLDNLNSNTMQMTWYYMFHVATDLQFMYCVAGIINS